MKKLLLLLLFSFCQSAYAATYYMATDGSNSANGSASTPWLTLQYSMSQMSAGDTLIVEDGVYTGSSNVLDYTHYPPLSNSSWTTIKARNDGAVLFDGESTRSMFDFEPNDVTNCHWIFEGIIWARSHGTSTILFAKSQYVKFLRCGGYDTDNGAAATFYCGRESSYVLFENCYAWGNGRYQFQAYLSDYIVFRNCVARFDYIDNGNENVALFTVYRCNYAEVQNCIGIDSDQTSYWSNYYALSGCFFVPSTDGTSDNVWFKNCIGLNSKLGGIQTADGSNNATFLNCVVWDCQIKDLNQPNFNFRGYASVMDHCTFGVSEGYTYPAFRSYDVNEPTHNDTEITNSIIYSFRGASTNEVFSDIEIYDYNSYYYNLNSPTPAAHDITNINPLTNSLLYITRIEDGSDLDGAGESGSDIGANIKTLIGTSGTLYGETGYNTDTGVSMWPFPNETLIRTKMKAYSGGGVSGDRGFCADGETLTHYIMNYLGNGNPYAQAGSHAPLSGRISVTGRGNVQ